MEGERVKKIVHICFGKLYLIFTLYARKNLILVSSMDAKE
jgi:hypothetical protein